NAGHAVIDGADQENDALLQKARIDVVGAFAAIGLLDHHRHEVVVVDLDWIPVSHHPLSKILRATRRDAPGDLASPSRRRADSLMGDLSEWGGSGKSFR